MKNWGILFSGQGAQKARMGLDCYQQDMAFKDVIDASSQSLAIPLVKILQDENGELSQTKFVQPALVAVSLGFYTMLKRDLPGLNIKGYLGLSLGEYSALMASGMLPFEMGMHLLKIRANAMEQDSQATPSTMAAIVGPKDLDRIQELCRAASAGNEFVHVSNYNSPKQIVLGGTLNAVAQVVDAINANHLALKAIPLKVSGAFHTPLYQHSATVLQTALQDTTFVDGDHVVLSNTTGMPFTKDDLPQILAKQVVCPTHFSECLQRLIDDYQMNATLEIGAGKTLSTFAKQLDRKLIRKQITDYDTYQKFIEEVGEDAISR